MLDIHPASESERLAAYRNVHDVWSGGLDLETHVQRRLASVQHNRADWFVGCSDGEVVTSLATYPLKFHFRGRVVPGFSIGSVHTQAGARGKGFAPQLIRWVEEYQETAGSELSLLYSVIDPEYYARLGYQVCPSWAGTLDTANMSNRTMGYRLQRFDPLLEIDRLRSIYDDEHGRYEIAIARDVEYWNYLLTRDADDEFHWIINEADTRIGYVRLQIDTPRAKLRDLAMAQELTGGLEMMLDAIAALLCERGVSTLFGWLPNLAGGSSRAQLTERSDEITMVKLLAGDATLTDDELSAAMHFREIDHV